jgi:hypothetical protein
VASTNAPAEVLLQMAEEAEDDQNAWHGSHLCHRGGHCFAEDHLCLEPGPANWAQRKNCLGAIVIMSNGVELIHDTCKHVPACIMPANDWAAGGYVAAPHLVEQHNRQKAAAAAAAAVGL